MIWLEVDLYFLFELSPIVELWPFEKNLMGILSRKVFKLKA